MLADRLPAARYLLADKAYDADHWRAWLKRRGIRAVIPNKINRKTPISLQQGVGKAFQAGVRGADTLGKLSRYESGIERTFYKALHELQSLQARRSGGSFSIPQAIDIDVSTNT